MCALWETDGLDVEPYNVLLQALGAMKQPWPACTRHFVFVLILVVFNHVTLSCSNSPKESTAQFVLYGRHLFCN